MAHKKAGGSSRNGRDTAGRRLGVKSFGGEIVIAGNIIIRQRGTTWHPGTGVGIGKDHTIFATIPGTVNSAAPRKTARLLGYSLACRRIGIPPDPYEKGEAIASPFCFTHYIFRLENHCNVTMNQLLAAQTAIVL